MKRLTCVCLALVFPALIAVALLLTTRPATSADAARWADSSISADPARIDLVHQRETTLTVSLASGEPVSASVSVTCTVEGRVIAAEPGVYLTGSDAITWTGEVSATEAFTFTVSPDTWPTATATCVIHDGTSFGTTVEVKPLRQSMPLVMQDHAAAWWLDYPLCPGEESDRAGFGEEGGNDLWDVYEGKRLPVPYTCIGWIHWARGYWDSGEIPDSDHFYFAPQAGRTVRVTLARLPVDYRLIGYVPREDPGGGVKMAGETLVSAHLGTKDEQFVVEASVGATHTLIVHSQIGEFGQVEYDPVQPYLLSVTEEW